jgi:eukaryotic-like serine/threonine-protein kinase
VTSTATTVVTQTRTEGGAQAPSPSRETSDEAPRGNVRDPGNGQWIAQLASVPVSSGTATRDARLRRVQGSFPDAAAFPSSQYASLRAGYWVIWAGPYADGNAALSACQRAGMSSSNCLGRLVSTSASDRKYMCTRAGSSGCARD